MPRVPTILASEQFQYTLPPDATIGAFNTNPGLGNLAQGIDSAAGSAAHVAQLQRRRENQVAAQYVGDSYFQEMSHLDEWQQQHQNSENYYQEFRAYAEPRIKQYEDRAPTKESRLEVRQRLQQGILSRAHVALGVTERTRLDKSKESVISQTSMAVNSVRMMMGSPHGDPIAEANAAREQIRNTATEMFSSTDPEVARKFRGYVDGEFALLMAEVDEGAAATVVKSSEDLTEEQKLILLNKIGVISKASDTARVDQAQQMRKDNLAAVASGVTKEKLPLEAYSALKDPAQEKREDDRRVDVLVSVNQNVEKLGGLNPAAQARELNQLRSQANTDQGRLIYQGTAERVAKIQELQENDRVAWLMGYNPDVKLTASILNTLPSDSPLRPTHQELLDNAILKYQGNPNGDSNVDAYLSLASNDRQLLTMDQATRNAAHINQGAAREVIDRIGQVMAQHPNKDHQYTVFSNMVTMPPGKEGIRQEYQLVWQNKDQWWVPSFVNVLADAKSFGQLTDERRSKMEEEIEGSATWRLFQQSMVGPGGDRADEIAGFRSGVAMYANYFHVTQGDKLSQSVAKSVKALISSTMGFTEVHGRPLMVLKEREDGTPRTDEEVKDTGRRLTMSLRDLDPREINQAQFVALAQISPDEASVNRLQALRDDITRNAFFVTDDSGQYVSLYMPGDSGHAFQLRDKEDRAFQIKLDDLPTFKYWDPTGQTISPFNLPRQIQAQMGELSEKPSATYPIRSGYGPGVATIDKLLGWPEKMTNWPTTGPQWRRKEVR